MPKRNVVPWTRMVSGLVARTPDNLPTGYKMVKHDLLFCDSSNKNKGSLFNFKRRRLEMVELNSITFVRALGACIRQNNIISGKQVHCLILKFGFCSDVYVGSALVDLYAKCGFVADALLVFDKIRFRDLVLWNVMVYCYALNGFLKEAFEVFKMMRSEGVIGDGFTFSSLLSFCSLWDCYELGLQIHGLVTRLSLDMDVFVCSALVDIYVKSGHIEDARRVFDFMTVRNVVCWNAIIVGYGKYGEGKESMKLLSQMVQGSLKPDELTLASVLSSCANSAAAYEAIQVHNYVVKNGFEAFVSIGNALITAYAKCGSIHNSFRSFCSISKPNLITWSSMVSSYAFHGLAKEAIDFFETMLREAVRPDGIAFVGVLSACSHAGLVEAGLHYFASMTKVYQIKPGQEHYACLVDLLGRGGHLEEAYNVLASMPFEPNANVLGAFIGACKVHHNTVLAKWAANKLFNLEPDEPVNYMLMSNIYAAVGCWDDVASARKMMKNKCGNKVPGCSWTEVGGTVHTFVSDNKSHPQALEIYMMLAVLIRLMKEEGCVSDLIFP